MNNDNQIDIDAHTVFKELEKEFEYQLRRAFGDVRVRAIMLLYIKAQEKTFEKLAKSKL